MHISGYKWFSFTNMKNEQIGDPFTNVYMYGMETKIPRFCYASRKVSDYKMK